MDELQEMRAQLITLKNSLNKSNILNNRLLKQVISREMTSLNKIVWASCISYPVTLLLLIGFCLASKINLWVAWSFGIFGLVDLLLDFRTLRLSVSELRTKTMLQLKAKLLKQKRERRIQNGIGLPLAVIWGVWLCVEFVDKFQIPAEIRAVVIIFLALIVVGAVAFGIWLLLRIERTTDSMINEIDEKNDLN